MDDDLTPERPSEQPPSEMIEEWQELRIGVSACLLGESVRYDGGHKRDRVVVEMVAREAILVPVCPEVEMGMGTPREPIGLLRTDGEVRLIGAPSGTDHTDGMHRYATDRVAELNALGLSGFILKKGSPSCGLGGIPVHDGAGGMDGQERGLFAQYLLERMPDLPVIEEDGLQEPDRLKAFMDQVRDYVPPLPARPGCASRGTPRSLPDSRRSADPPR